ncbi:MAG: M23 family peptidase [Caldilinea sp. CFX5]|nr:M23 family peptidase [Caldilinea sp. CFX5]
MQPQKLDRSAGATGDAALLQDLLTLGGRLATDAQHGGAALAILQTVLAATATRVETQVTGRLATAEAKLNAWVAPLVQMLEALGAAVPAVDSPLAAVALAKQLVQLLAQLAQGLTLDALRGHVQTLLDILEQDLGLTPDFLQTQIWTIIDEVISQLETLPPATPAQERTTRLGLACLLRRLKRRAAVEFQFPRFAAEFVAGELLALLRQLDLDRLLHELTCALAGLETALNAGTTLLELAPFGPSGVPILAARDGGAPRVALMPLADPASSDKDRYGWYATWLLQYKHRDLPLLGKDDLKDAGRLANRLKSPSSALDRFLRDRLTDTERTAIDGYDGAGAPSAALKFTILDLFNRLLRGESAPIAPALAQDARFPLGDVTLSSETREVGQKFSENEELIRYNRMVLEDALPQELEQLPRTFGQKFGPGLGEFLEKTTGLAGERVIVDKDKHRIRLGDKVLFSGENLEWQQASIFTVPDTIAGQRFYRVKRISPPVMDGFQFAIALINDFVRIIWRGTQIQPSHQVAPLLNALYDFIHGLAGAAGQRPISGHEFWGSKTLDGWAFGPQTLSTILSSLQGKHSATNRGNIFAFWITVVIHDIFKLAGPISITNLLRDVVMTLMTLINGDGGDDKAQNHKEITALVGVLTFFYTWLLVKLIPREDYVNPSLPQLRSWLLWWLGGLGAGLLAPVTGVLLAAPFARKFYWGGLAGDMVSGVLQLWITFWIVFFSTREGDTDDGKYNPRGAPFAGYPKKKQENGTETPSPYRLPYAKGTTLFVPQGNQGMWSHNNITNASTAQIYAYDFGHDDGEEVLASRPGTVVAFGEGIPDGSTADWNFIVLRHDVDDSGNPITPDANHDRDIGGNAVFTYAVYGHGKQNSVTTAFSRLTPPVATANIIGTKVKRGQPIMLAGDTGMSFHNHLHIHVQAEMAGPNTGTPPADRRTTAYTIPFIFQEVDGDGVCVHGNWYTSDNERRT